MKYIPQTGDIVFFRTKFDANNPMSWVSTAIRPIAKIKRNHVGLVGENWKKYYLFESIERGFLPSPLLRRIQGKDILIKRPKFTINEKDFNIRLNDLAGVTKYDFRGLLSDQLLLNVFHIWTGAKTEMEALERLYCYEAYWFLYKEHFLPEWWRQYPKDTIEVDWTYTVFQGIYK